MRFFKKSKQTSNTVVKKSIFKRKEKIIYVALVTLALLFSFRYIFWWFQPSHIPSNWTNPEFHLLDFLMFGLLSFVVFIGLPLRFGSWFALWFAAKPVYKKPQKGLKVAFLTCYVPGKEPVDMLIKTLKAMKAVRYPHDTWVLDEGDSNEVKQVCKELDVFHFSRYGMRRFNRPEGLYRAKTKAGNHNSWKYLHDHKYDVVAQIDMDHIPEPEYFDRTLGYFRDPKVAFVGMPQIYKNTDNWIAKGAAEQSYSFHGPLQQGFYGADMPFLIGTSHIYRTSAMRHIGGYAPTIVEDHLTGMLFYSKGWKGVFVPEILAKGEGPLNWVDYFNQQMRWSYGIFEIFFKHTPRLIWGLKWKQKINYFIAQLYYFTGVAVAIGFILIVSYLIFGIRSASMNLEQWISYSLPPFILANLIHVYTHRFNIDPKKEPIFGLTGMFLNLGANIIYALAFLKFLQQRKLKYMVTQKGSAGEKQLVPLSAFKLHLLIVFIMFVSLIYSFTTNHSAVQLRLWALFNVVTLTSVTLSIYWEKVYASLTERRLLMPVIRYAPSFIVGLIILLSIGLVYLNRNKLAYATIPPVSSEPIEIIEPVAGKITIPTDKSYLGMSFYQHNDLGLIKDVESQVGKNFSIIGYYQPWSGKDNQFDQSWANSISRNGSVPLITWEPWKPISGFDRTSSSIDQKEYRLSEIVNGSYDPYIMSYAKAIKNYKKPVMIRFAHEMNGNWYPWGSTLNTPQDYILAYRHVHEIFDGIGATNVTWVWSPNEVYSNPDVPYADQISLFYPGDDYVDYVGFSSFNWANNYKQNRWRTPSDLFGETVIELKKFNKPIIITETASADDTHNLLHKAKWIAQLAKYVEENPEIKGVVWFNTVDNGVDWTISNSNASAKAFKESFGAYFIQKTP